MATVTIPAEEWDYLKSRDAELSMLEAYGVDNWEGYSDALQGDWDE